MSTLSRRARWCAPPVALLLAAGSVAGLATSASAVQTTFTNGGGIAIADPVYDENSSAITITDNSQASLYPSTINFAESGVIADVDVYLYSVDHGYPDDVDVLLVGPGGQQATIMSDAGRSNDLVGQYLSFDDEASSPLPDEDAFDDSVSWQPTNYEGADTFPTVPAVSGASALSVFDGTNVQGDWKLYVVDDDGGVSGDISEGWALSISLRSVPSPSQINVSGLGSRVSDVNLTLSGLTHTYPGDIDILLVGPGGQQATVMSDAGFNNGVVSVNLAIDDEALVSLPEAAQITTGSYKPTNFETSTDVFPTPAPAATGATVLSAFDATNPNGTWSLYVADDAGSDVGTLASWSLDIETDNTPPTGTIAVNGGAATVGSGSVTLSLAASDPGTPTSGVTEMRFSNDGVTFSAYQAYAATAAWTLSSGEGTKTVFAQFRDNSGIQSAVVSDTITLDTLGPKAKKLKPQNHAKAVKVTTKVKVVSSEKLTKGSVTKKTVFLKEKGSSGKVKASVSYSASNKTITLTPKSDLHSGATYKVTVKGVKDLLGHAWDQKPKKSGAQPLKFSFTTA